MSRDDFDKMGPDEDYLQPPLFAGLDDGPRIDAAYARRTDPETSHEAAASVTKISELHALILECLKGCPCCDAVLIARVRNSGFVATDASIRSRRAELVQRKQVLASGEHDTTATGRRTIIWRLA